MNHASNGGGRPIHGQTRIEIYTDGSALGNPGPGGYGGVLVRRDHADAIINEREIWGPSSDTTTNNRMEMTAVLKGLQALGSKTSEPITVICDSSLIIKGMTEWLAGWKAKGWRNSQKKPVVNRDLWELIDAEAESRNVEWQWVRGHNGNELNERADGLANRGSALAKRRLSASRRAADVSAEKSEMADQV